MKRHKNKYTSRRIEALTHKRNQKVENYLHKASRILVNYCIENDIDTVAIGYNLGWKHGVTLGKINNQNFVFIPFRRLIQMIEYKCKLEGIKVILINEAYTSKCSALDFKEIGKKEKYLGKRIKRGLFETKDGLLINADINASINILRNVSTTVIVISSMW
jgi:IS605 OrfB family transposase